MHQLALESSPRSAATCGRAVVLRGPRALDLVPQTPLALAPHQVLVRLEGCGVCGSNLAVWEGRPWFNYPWEPGAPGHEGWGVVEEIGADVRTLKRGDRVAALTYHAFADYDVADAANCVVLPDALAGEPFPGEALGCAMNIFKRSDLQPWHTVGVVGVGFMGALLVNLAARTGARVIALSRRPFALATARRMGAAAAIETHDRAAAVRRVLELTDGAGCERVIEATGLQDPLRLAGEIICERGRLVIAGFHQDGMREVNLQLWNWRGIDVINAHERDPRRYVEGMSKAVDAVASGRLDPSPLYTHRYPLERAGEALAQLSAREGDFLKALLIYDR